MSNSVRPQRRQPTRLPSPWDSPGKNTGVGCHFLLQCIKVKSEVAQACLTLHDLMDCSLPSSAHGIFQARVLESGAIAFSESVSGPPLFSFVKPSAPFPQSCSSRNAFFCIRFTPSVQYWSWQSCRVFVCSYRSSGLQALKEVYNIFFYSHLYFLLLFFLPTPISVPFRFSFLPFSFLFLCLMPGAC